MSSMVNYDTLLAHIQELRIPILDFVNHLRPFSSENEIGLGVAMTVYQSQLRRPSLPNPIKVALKVPNQNIKENNTDEDEDISEMLTVICQELRMLKYFIHPYIIAPYGITFRDLKPILVVELAKASLSDYLVSRMVIGNRVRWETKARFCYEVAEGIKALHTVNIVLGDIKAENILLFGNSEEEDELICKLSDFGYSSVASIADGKETRGTPNFWAPECTPMAPLEMKSYANKSTKNNYSYGLFVWQVAMDGEVPYEDMNIEDIDEIKHFDIQLLELMNQLPEDTLELFKKIIIGMTQYEPTKREDFINVKEIISSSSNINFNKIDRYTNSRKAFEVNINTLTQGVINIDIESFRSSAIPLPIKKRLFRMYEVAASKGDIEAAYFLSVCYKSEFGVNFDKTKMISWAIQASKSGNLEAVKNIVDFYVMNIDQFPHDLSQLFPRILQIAEDGHKGSQLFISNCYKKGICVEKDASKQKEWETKYTKNRLSVSIGFMEESPLHYAARQGNIEAIKFFIQQEGMDVNTKNTSGITPLYLATFSNQTRAINILVDEFGADVNIKEINGWAPVHAAADRGNNTILRMLVIKFGAVANVRSNYGITPLYLAARNGRFDTLRLLVSECGVDVNVKEDDGWTSLHIAAGKGHINTVKLLVAELGADIRAISNFGRTPLSSAAYNGHIDIVKLLVVEFGADVNVKENDGWTPLHLAAQNGHLNTVKLLAVEFRADVNGKSNTGQTPLYSAARNGHVEIVKFLVEFGAEVNSKTNNGWTPLHIAAGNGHIDIVKLFVIDFGADVNVKSNTGLTPLHSAAKYGHVDTVKLLVDELEADINARDCNNLTPLIFSSGERCEDVALALSEHPRANNYVKTDDGQTLLHLAVRYRREIVVKILVERFDLDIHAKDSKGQTPLDLADDSPAHLGIYCDCCETFPIIGERYKCTVCVNFDFCSTCYSSVDNFNHEHIFRIVELPSVKYLFSP